MLIIALLEGRSVCFLTTKLHDIRTIYARYTHDRCTDMKSTILRHGVGNKIAIILLHVNTINAVRVLLTRLFLH